MAIFEITKESMTPLSETSFDVEGIYERNDLQRQLKQNIGVLSSDLMVIAEEYGDWIDSNRRIDLLCIDAEANIVVVEIKRTSDGGHMELQAIRYASMLSTMTFKQLIDAHASYVRPLGRTHEEATAAVLAFLRWDEPNEDDFAGEVRIILAAADFSKEITTSVMWLNDHEIDIRCIRLKPYRLPDGRVLLDVQQIIPLPEAADYQTKIRAKEQAERGRREERHEIRYQFWTDLLEYAKTKTTIFAGKSPTAAGGFGIGVGKAGLKLGFITRGNDSNVEVEIDFRDLQKSCDVFHHFHEHSQEIGQVFEGELEWDFLLERRASYIRSFVSGGWKSPREEWPLIHKNLVDKVIKLETAVRPYIASIPA